MTTKPADPAIEKAARALANLDYRATPHEGDFINARAAVIAYLTATLEPTQAVLDAGREAMPAADGYDMPDDCPRVYRAMRSAELSSLKGKVE